MIQGHYKHIGEPQLPIKSTEGHYITFADGSVLYDCHAGRSANPLGHNVPQLIAARQGNFCCDWDLQGPAWKDFQDKIGQLIGDQYDILIPALSGTDAVDNAIRLAWWRKEGHILTRPDTYHSGSISGWQHADRSKKITSNWKPYDWVKYTTSRTESSSVSAALLNNQVSAVIVDSVSWFSGVKQNDSRYWNEVYQSVKSNDALFIADEVLTGFGKMGEWSHFLSMGITPDIITFGKALTAGHENLSLVCIHKDTTKQLNGQWLAIGNTRSFNEVGASVALAAIEMMEQQQLLQRVKDVIVPLLTSLRDEVNSLGSYNASTAGTMISFDLNTPSDNLLFCEKMHSEGYWHHYAYPFIQLFYNATEQDLYNLRKTIIKIIKEIK
jgi:4-aminobutyrate aminotransferase-like enzyme